MHEGRLVRESKEEGNRVSGDSCHPGKGKQVNILGRTQGVRGIEHAKEICLDGQPGDFKAMASPQGEFSRGTRCQRYS